MQKIMGFIKKNVFSCFFEMSAFGVVAMSTFTPISLADFSHAMAAGHAEDFQIYVLE